MKSQFSSTALTRSSAIGGIFILLIVTLNVFANPHVAGYERFHSSKPSVEGGAILFSELGCASCHGDSPVETLRKGPSLINLRNRVDHTWITSFLKDPSKGRPGSTMPKMTHGMTDKEIEALVAYLGTKGRGAGFASYRHSNAERGSAIYHEKGCISCHSPTADFKPGGSKNKAQDFSLAISHPDFKKKTSLYALNHFLSNPSRYRPDGRMPHIVLDKQESMDVAAHLLDFQGSDPTKAKAVKKWPKAIPNMVQKGKELIQKMNCASCHDIPKEQAKPIILLPKKLSNDKQHCFSGKPVKGIPHYDLTKVQQESLKLFLANRKLNGVKKIHTTLAAMNCYACHSRDAVGGPTTDTNPWFIGDKDLGDSGRIPPPLTGIGFKLQRKWMEGVLSGKKGHKVRPYLKTQMPAYKNQTKILADLFEKIDIKKTKFELTHSPEALKAGRTLLGTQGGVNCITCHNWGNKKSLGIQALDISSLDRRLNPDWFYQYMLDPKGYRPNTLMPAFWPKGKSSIPELLGGKTEKQIAAIWAFIEKGKGLPKGFPDRSNGKFELVPKDRPMIQRTFFKATGTKAILVGFPGEIHIAYDGLNCYPTMVWKGRFFDGYNTWFSRFAPIEKPLSKEIYPFAKSKKKGRFHGYQIDDKGNPTFLVKVEGRMIKEKFSVAEGKLYRTISWKKGEAPTVTHPLGVKMKNVSKTNNLTFIYSWK